MPNITIIHPDLGIGGAERLIIDAALVLQSRGHKVTIYTSHHDPTHCFDETRDGQLDVRVRGDTIFPPHVLGRAHVLMAVLRQVHLVFAVLGELSSGSGGSSGSSAGAGAGASGEGEGQREGEKGREGKEEEVFIVDQLAACVPVLKMLGEGYSPSQQRQRILFYCHFPDQLLARRNEGGGLLRLAKGVYRVPFDWFEGWAVSAADRVVANSKFTRRVVGKVFGDMGDVSVVYPAVDTEVSSDSNSGPGSGSGAIWDKKIVLSVNRFERKKGIELAIRAYHGLGGERGGRRLVIAGGYDNRIRENVEYHTELNTLATSLGLQTATANDIPSALSTPDDVDVLFLPSVNSSFRDTLLSQASLLLYTPINEHFGIVPVEAMRAGIPVLASNTGGPLETIVEGQTGWLRNANNVPDWTAVIHNVLYQMTQADINRMASAARDRVLSDFSLTAMGERFDHEINVMLSNPRRPFHGARTLVVSLLSAVFLVVAWIVLFVF